MAISNLNLKNLPRSTQIMLFAVLVGCLGAAFYFYYLQDLVKKRDALHKEIDGLKVAVAQATAAEMQLKQFKKELAQLDEDLARLRSILPAQKETPIVLRSVQEMAASSSLKILKFIPQPIVNHDFYSDWPITVEVEGNYNGLGAFFDKIGKATRLINVGSIAIRSLESSADPSPSRTLSASCTATTFVFREDKPEEPDNALDAKSNKKLIKKTNKKTPVKKGAKQ
jgi:type IV pilus assembly protein PilO